MNTREIACLAKVSPATVSRALRNSSSVSKKTREIILKIAREQDYYLDKNRAGVKAHKPKVFGLLVPRGPEESLVYQNTNFYSSIFTGFKEEIEKHKGYILTIPYFNNKLSEEIKLINKENVKSLAIIHTTETDDKFIMDNKDIFPVPFLVLNRKFDGDIGINYVRVDEVLGGYMAASYLYKLGHKRICCLSLSDNLVYLKDRITGYEKLVKEKSADITQSSLIKCNSPEESYAVMKEFFKNKNRPTGIFITEEELAPGVLKVLVEAGKKVPDNVSLVAYNDYGYSLKTEPQLSTIRLPSKEIGRLAGQVACNLVEIEEPQLYNITLRPKLIERYSCASI